ncbi:MAG: hypothetical protein NT042_14170 [Sulfuritalea sp.]|nr:hypothetical protein [Sulfuritalea sp.]
MQAAGLVFAVAGLGQHRVSHGAQGYRGRHAGAGRAAEQEGRQHDGAPRSGRLVAHGGEGEVDIELARPGILQECAVDGEQDDQRRRDVDRRAEDAFERHEHVPDQALQVVAAVRPWCWQMRAEQGIGDEAEHDGRHHPARCTPRGFEHQHDQRHAQYQVPAIGCGGAVGEVVAAGEQVGDDADAEQRRRPVPPAGAVAKALRHGKQQEGQEEHEADMDRAQGLRRHDAVGGVEMEQRHDHGDHRDKNAHLAPKPVRGTFFLLDEFLGLFQLLVTDDDSAVLSHCGY